MTLPEEKKALKILKNKTEGIYIFRNKVTMEELEFFQKAILSAMHEYAQSAREQAIGELKKEMEKDTYLSDE